MEHFISSVVSPHDPDKHDWSPGEGDHLPGPAAQPGVVTHHLPVPLIH